MVIVYLHVQVAVRILFLTIWKTYLLMEKNVGRNMASKSTKKLNKVTQGFYDSKFLDLSMERLTLSGSIAPTILRYRNVRVPRYFPIWIPVISRHYSDEYGDYEGILLTFVKKDLFKIGTKIEKQPVYRKLEGGINFKKYGKEIWRLK